MKIIKEIVNDDEVMNALAASGSGAKRLYGICESFASNHICVLGDFIVDQYVSCEGVGMSAEAPVLVIKELKYKNYVGGAGVVAKHIASLGAKCSLITVIGDDTVGKDIEEDARQSIDFRPIIDPNRPTTLKIRYMVENQKLLRVSKLRECQINEEIERNLIVDFDKIVDSLTGVVISDFGYGVITPKLLDHVREACAKRGIKIFGDVQSSSQIGNVLKLKDFFLAKPNEKEARLALSDSTSGVESIAKRLLKKLRVQKLVLTMAERGMIAYEACEEAVKSFYMPALNPNPLDVMGAGDSTLSALALSFCTSANTKEATAIASIVAAIATSKVGNVPVRCEEIKEFLQRLKEF